MTPDHVRRLLLSDEEMAHLQAADPEVRRRVRDVLEQIRWGEHSTDRLTEGDVRDLLRGRS